METCKICNKEFKNLKSLSTHLTKEHNFLTKDYYDKFLKKEGDGQCYVCGNETSYRNINVGYLDNCSIECRSKNKTIKRDYWKGKKQSEGVINKRVNNTNQIEKQKALESNNLIRYGVKNVAELEIIKNKISISNQNKIKSRTPEWQENIINSKRTNGTLNHNNLTKKKISDKLNKYHQSNLDREKYINTSGNMNHICGWYYGMYFRSSLELSFLVNNSDKNFETCEKNKYRIIYEKNNDKKIYYPDFTDGEFIYEIKPSKLLLYKDNDIKINKGFEIYGDKFKVITEIICPYITKSKILELIADGSVIMNEKSLGKLKKYNF
jgi:hypothetical protein